MKANFRALAALLSYPEPELVEALEVLDAVFLVVQAVLDLRDAATRRALGVDEEALIGEWSPDAPNPATLNVAAAARDLGVDGMVVPSAAGRGGWNLAILPRAFDRVRLADRRRAVPVSIDS